MFSNKIVQTEFGEELQAFRDDLESLGFEATIEDVTILSQGNDTCNFFGSRIEVRLPSLPDDEPVGSLEVTLVNDADPKTPDLLQTFHFIKVNPSGRMHVRDEDDLTTIARAREVLHELRQALLRDLDSTE